MHDTFYQRLQSKNLFSIQEPRAYLLNMAKHLLIDQHRRYSQNYLAALAQHRSFKNDADSMTAFSYSLPKTKAYALDAVFVAWHPVVLKGPQLNLS